jgi:hypothetical protein
MSREVAEQRDYTELASNLMPLGDFAFQSDGTNSP